MKVNVTYKEIKRPIDKVILEMNLEEAKILRVLVGNIIGKGRVRDLSNIIFESLLNTEIFLEEENQDDGWLACDTKEYKDIVKEAKKGNIRFCWEFE